MVRPLLETGITRQFAKAGIGIADERLRHGLWETAIKEKLTIREFRKRVKEATKVPELF